MLEAVHAGDEAGGGDDEVVWETEFFPLDENTTGRGRRSANRAFAEGGGVVIPRWRVWIGHE